MNIEKYIKENLESLNDTLCKVFISPNIPEKKLNNAIAAYAKDVVPNYILGIVDTTLFGGAKEGFLFTGNKMYYADMNNKLSFDLELISGLSTESYEITDKEGNVITKYRYYLEYSGEKQDITKMLSNINADGFVKFIQKIIDLSKEQENGFESTNQACPLAMMSEEIKEKYIQLISNFAYSDDNQIDSTEYAEIMTLIALNSLNNETRIKIRSYMYDNSQMISNDDIIKFLEDNVDAGSIEPLKLSLVKDIINIFVCKNKSDLSDINWQESESVVAFVNKLGIEYDKVNYIIENIIKNREIIANRQDDIQLKKNMQELVAKAGAVGVPLAAVYLSGSVLGVSAAGMTSGLAALGMGGVLGFSSMFTGVGVAILLGVGAYQGIKKVIGMGELEKNKQRELLLAEIAKNSQKTLNYLIEDVNEISRLLQEQLIAGEESELKIKKLAGILAMMSQGAKETGTKIDIAEKEKLICKLPTRIKPELIQEMASGATKKNIRELIINAYSEERINEEGQKISNCLDTQLSYSELDEVYKALTGIGFYNMAENSKAHALNTAKGFMKGILG